MDHGSLYIIIAAVVGLWMTWGIGANDLANILSTAIGSKAISVRQALTIAIIFEVAGAYFGGSEVSATIRSGVIDASQLAHTPILLAYGMLSVLLAGACWMTFASWLGMPVSVTNAIVGALVGVGVVVFGAHAIHWQTVRHIALSWVLSPTIAGVVAYLLFVSIRRSILGVDDPLAAARRLLPIYLVLVAFILSMMTSLKALHHFIVQPSWILMIVTVLATTFVVTGLGWLAMLRIRMGDTMDRHTRFMYIESLFSVLMALTACAMVFAHGSNDVAIAVGPVSGVINFVNHGHFLHSKDATFGYITLAGCAGVVIGLIMYGRKVIETVGQSITLLTPSRAFAATLAAATTVVVSTGTGIPVSATQTLVGAVLGVGLARGIDALDLTVVRNIFMSWMITIPAAAGLATVFFIVLKTLSL
ncbi:MAG: inorganic phosphate transporter [Gammaproteobacteria bacterium]|nr:inorganic phosphate transporter [Gammaproteobacteria bacterium]